MAVMMEERGDTMTMRLVFLMMGFMANLRRIRLIGDLVRHVLDMRILRLGFETLGRTKFRRVRLETLVVELVRHVLDMSVLRLRFKTMGWARW